MGRQLKFWMSQCDELEFIDRLIRQRAIFDFGQKAMNQTHTEVDEDTD